MTTLLFSFILLFNSNAQDTKISTIDFVQVLEGRHAETLYYYENNWLELRKKATKLDYIDSYSLIKVEYSDESPYHMILVTTYKNQEQFDLREDNFGKLIEERGDRKLLNDLQPKDFRTFVGGVRKGEHVF